MRNGFYKVAKQNLLNAIDSKNVMRREKCLNENDIFEHAFLFKITSFVPRLNDV